MHAEVPHASYQPIEPRVWDCWRECVTGVGVDSVWVCGSERGGSGSLAVERCGCGGRVGQSVEAQDH